MVIVVGTSTRKPLPVLKLFLESVEKQILPPNVQLVPVFVPDGMDKDALDYLTQWVEQRKGKLLRGVPSRQQDFADSGVATHQWQVSSMQRVGQNKNKILAEAAALRADYVWFCDADLVMGPRTLWSLYYVDQPIVCGVYWTRWSKTPPGQPPMPAAPQVWLRHPYQLDGRGMEEWEFRERLVNRDLVQVWGQGACTLLKREVWEKGISFSPAPGVAQEGLMAGEDRQFCIHAERRHVPMYADAWPDIYHLYHLPDDLAVIPVEPAPRDRAAFGDLVSFTTQAAEPVQQPNGQWVNVGPQHIRGRLGSLKALPEILTALTEMQRGETRLVACQCPLHHPIPPYRGRQRLFRVTLIDHKPFDYAPVLREDLLPAGAVA